MTSQEFCYWLQGLFELANPDRLDVRQTDLIKRHLNMVFIHEIDPKYPEKETLNSVHSGIKQDQPIPVSANITNPLVMRC